MACSAWVDRLQQPHTATEAAQGTQSHRVLARNTDLPSALTLVQPEDPLPNLTFQVAWSGGQPVPPSQLVMAVPASS